MADLFAKPHVQSPPASTSLRQESVGSEAARAFSPAGVLFAPQLLSAIFEHIQAGDDEAQGAGEDEGVILSDDELDALMAALESEDTGEGEPVSIEVDGWTYVLAVEDDGASEPSWP
jgi:hypothetical protein